ncbi:FAD-binding domain-containing protein [Cadophora sp. DSE1049]|nr:FAD-binding domain-containing protein [Cadophora sp. DSE1049]
MSWCKLLFGILITRALALPSENSICRVLPGDAGWPKTREWNQFNASIGGKLFRGEPLGSPCFAPNLNSAECANVKEDWGGELLFINDPVNIMSRYWQNNTCNPLSAPNGTCTSGNLASYAVEVTDAATAAAGIRFARQRNLRLTIKNTGHDYLGRSSGKGSLALWTHNLDSREVVNYTSPSYTGPALRIGAGVEAYNAISTVSQYGLRVFSGYCVTIGLAGGYSQNAGYGPFGSSYGTASDQVLEWEVMTADGHHLVASPTNNTDLYWALSGGGSGNYALVLSTTVKAYADGAIAGAFFEYTETNASAFWESVRLWHEELPRFNSIPGLSTVFEFTNNFFRLIIATWPGASQSDIQNVFEPFLQQVKALNITVIGTRFTYEPSYEAHYSAYPPNSSLPVTSPEFAFPMNINLGGRLIPSSSVQTTNLDELISTYQHILREDGVPLKAVAGASSNVSHAVAGNTPGSNAVLPAWRDSLYTASAGIVYSQTALPEELAFYQVKVNEYQDLLRNITPGSGAYINEATYDNPHFKEDYYGENYERLLKIKKKYDPHGVFWQHAAVGSDVNWREDREGRLCRV